MLKAASGVSCRELAKPSTMIMENHARTNFEGSNPHFRDIFEIFWAHGYTATTTDAEQRVVTGRDLDVWVRGDRPIPVGANFAFARMQ
jgi:hypothetical protein